MKELSICLLGTALFFLSGLGCGNILRDADIKQVLVGGSKEEAAFAGVNYTIQEGVVTLTGNCPSEKERNKVEERVRHTSGVKEVYNNLAIAPVILDGDFPLKQAADSVLVKYPAVWVEVQDSIILVNGSVKQDALERLSEGLNKLQPRGVHLQVSAR